MGIRPHRHFRRPHRHFRRPHRHFRPRHFRTFFHNNSHSGHICLNSLLLPLIYALLFQSLLEHLGRTYKSLDFEFKCAFFNHLNRYSFGLLTDRFFILFLILDPFRKTTYYFDWLHLALNPIAIDFLILLFRIPQSATYFVLLIAFLTDFLVLST